MSNQLTGGDQAVTSLDQRYFYTDINALNQSGVEGYALLSLDDATDTLSVRIHAEGLEPGQTHVQHIHGFPDDAPSRTPSLTEDAARSSAS